MGCPSIIMRRERKRLSEYYSCPCEFNQSTAIINSPYALGFDMSI
jgi:hypothetical protein